MDSIYKIVNDYSKNKNFYDNYNQIEDLKDFKNNEIVINIIRNDINKEFLNQLLKKLNLEEKQKVIETNNNIPDSIKQTLFDKTQKLEKKLNLNSQNKFNIIQYIETVYDESKLDMFKDNYKNILNNNIKISFEDILVYQNILKDLLEDLTGSVRVYIRIRKEENNFNLFINENNSIEIDNRIYGPFESVFDFNKSTQDIYKGIKPRNLQNKNQNKGFIDIVKKVKKGYNAFVFGYGFSGSGKTYTMIGNNKDGLMFKTLDEIKEDIDEINYQIFEIYGYRNKVKAPKSVEKYQQYIIMYDENIKEYPYRKDEYEIINDNFYSNFDLLDPFLKEYKNYKKIPEYNSDTQFINTSKNNKTINIKNNLNQNLENINQIRKRKGRIDSTPNNKESSRSHLFIKFDIKFKNGKKSNLVFSDLGGSEDSNKIIGTYFNKGKFEWLNVKNNKYNIKQLIDTPLKNKNILNKSYTNYFSNILEKIGSRSQKSEINDIINNILNERISNKEKKSLQDLQKKIENFENKAKYIVLQGMYINETLNYLRTYLSNYDPLKNIKIKHENTNSLFADVLKRVAEPKNGSKTKFVMLGTISQRKDKKIGTIDTLKYMEKINRK